MGGTFEQSSEGSLLGDALGNFEGDMLGVVLGDDDGALDGIGLTSPVVGEGSGEGSEEGYVDGEEEGRDEGTSEGTLDGASDEATKEKVSLIDWPSGKKKTPINANVPSSFSCQTSTPPSSFMPVVPRGKINENKIMNLHFAKF